MAKITIPITIRLSRWFKFRLFLGYQIIRIAFWVFPGHAEIEIGIQER